jgi:hypothetical protein
VTRSIGLGLALLLLLSSAPSSAFVRARTTNGIAIHWPGSCVYMQPSADGTADMPDADTFDAFQRAIGNWNGALRGNAYLQLMYDEPRGNVEAHLDGINVIRFRSDRWCHPEDAQEHNVCYPDVAAGITTVFFVDDGHSTSGEIEDTDIELNDINFYFVNEVAGAPLPKSPDSKRQIADLENTVTHELGHVMGLDHTCKDANTPKQEVDENGNPPPDCTLVMRTPTSPTSEAIMSATMYNFYTPGEISKRMPHSDDIAGIANAYPIGKDPGVCKHTNLSDYGSGCSVDGRSHRPLASIAILMVALVALVARRRLD